MIWVLVNALLILNSKVWVIIVIASICVGINSCHKPLSTTANFCSLISLGLCCHLSSNWSSLLNNQLPWVWRLIHLSVLVFTQILGFVWASSMTAMFLFVYVIVWMEIDKIIFNNGILHKTPLFIFVWWLIIL